MSNIVGSWLYNYAAEHVHQKDCPYVYGTGGPMSMVWSFVHAPQRLSDMLMGQSHMHMELSNIAWYGLTYHAVLDP